MQNNNLKYFFIEFNILLNFINLFGNPNVPIHQNKFDFVSVDYILKKNSFIKYHKLLDPYHFTFQQFPGSLWPFEQPYDGTLGELFTLVIPQGKVISDNGFVIIDDRYLLRELTPTSFKFHHYVNHALTTPYDIVRKVPGRVAVITKLHAQCYAHWLTEVLGRLAILEALGIDFDWLYVSYNKTQDRKNFIKETLEAWGYPAFKIIDPAEGFHCIQADELIVPSLTNRHVPTPGKQFAQGTSLCAAFPHPWIIEYIRNKFLPMVKNHVSKKTLAKRIYITRKDAHNMRVFHNEDDLIAALKLFNFEVYELTKLPFLDQVKLFNEAEIIVGAHGSNLSNIIFCDSKKVKVVEIFQQRQDLVNYNIAQVLELDYIPVTTVPFDFFGHCATTLSSSSINDVIAALNLIE